MKTNVYINASIYILLLHTSVAFHFPNPGIDDPTSQRRIANGATAPLTTVDEYL